MDPLDKKILKSLTIEMRHLLEGYFTPAGAWVPGDLENRLRSLGIRRDRDPVPVDELHLNAADLAARRVVDAYVAARQETGVDGGAAVAEFIRETAYTWANRLVAIRCMEARQIIDDDVVLTKPVYAGRSLRHHRLVRKSPELERTEDSGLFAALDQAFHDLAERLPLAFDPKAPGIALRPSVATLKTCIALLSGTQTPPGQDAAGDDVFKAPDALGWAYQYWNTEEKQRVFDAAAGKGPDRKRHKIEGANIVPATQLYTEPYMVKFLVQNSIGALWASMHPETGLAAGWEYFVADADRAVVVPRAPDTLTFLDPACGSGHFLLEAFDVLFSIYREDQPDRSVDSTVFAILTKNLHGIDIDQRAVEIAQVALWMKAAEKLGNPWEFLSPEMNLVATNLRLPKGTNHLEAFLVKHPEDRPLKPALQVVFEGLAHADELGALLQVEEPVEKELRLIKQREDQTGEDQTSDPQTKMFRRGEQTALPLTARSFADWRCDVLGRLQAHFAEEAKAADLVQAFFGKSVERALGLFDLLSMRYDVVAANPPYMGSSNMGPVVHRYVEAHYAAGSRDLYAAFILRCGALLSTGGTSAMVTQRSYLTNTDYDDLRSYLLTERAPELVADLGTGAFEELSGEKVSVALSIAVADRGRRDALFLDGRGFRSPSLKNEALRGGTLPRYRVPAGVFERLPGQRFMYEAPVPVLRLFENDPWECKETSANSFALARRGLDTGEVGRWVRYWWEVGGASDDQWAWHLRGADGARWSGRILHVVRWSRDVRYLRAFGRAIIPNPGLYFRPGVTFSRIGASGLLARVYGSDVLISDSGSGVIPIRSSVPEVVGLLSSKCVAFLLSLIDPSFNFQTGHINVLPVPEHSLTAEWEQLLAEAVDAADTLAKLDPVEPVFVLQTGAVWDVAAAAGARARAARARLEGVASTADALALRAYFGEETPQEVLAALGRRPERDAVPDEPGESLTGEAGVPAEDAVDDVASNMMAGDFAMWYLSAHVLSLLGFEWARVRVAEAAKDGNKSDGIVPLTFVPGGSALAPRLRARLLVLGAATGETELAEALGTGLEPWLNTRFFSHHLSQFKKRPPAWQIQSGPFRYSRPPAFACLVYAQRMTADTLSRIRTQYVGPWMASLHSDRTGLERIEKPTADQSLRLDELQEQLGELVRFETALRGVEESGFDTPALRQFAVHDALQSLVKPLLVRFRSELGALEQEWCWDARAIDPSLVAPLTTALDALPSACARAVAATDLAPADDEAAIREAVIDAATRLATFAMAEAIDNWEKVFSVWCRDQREAALAAGRKPPKLKAERDAALALRARVHAWRPATIGISSFVSGVPILDPVCGEPGKPTPATLDEFVRAEGAYKPDVNDGVRVNIAPLQKAGVLAADVLASKEVGPAIADRAVWRADERRWVREGRLPQPGWWPKEGG